MILRWLWAAPSRPAYIRPWNRAVADRHAEATERLLLGAAGPARVVGDRIVERREQAVAARRQREAEQRAVVLVWRGRQPG